jgi:phosphohistidine phosphatase
MGRSLATRAHPASSGSDDAAQRAGDEAVANVGSKGTLDVYLVRHAFAGHADAARWPDDAERPLTAKGIRDFRTAARGLRELVPDVDCVLSSGYARAWQTAELLHEVAGWPKPQACAVLEAGQRATSALDVLRNRSEESVALVGHEPYLSSLASLLCTGGEDTLRLQLKKGAVALVCTERDVRSSEGRLIWSLAPKHLRALAPASREST